MLIVWRSFTVKITVQVWNKANRRKRAWSGHKGLLLVLARVGAGATWRPLLRQL